MTPFRFAVVLAIALLSACSGDKAGPQTANAGSGVAAAADAPIPKRPGFLGAFVRADGNPPYGPFSVFSKNTAPQPYPTPGTKLFGPSGYCDAVASNGQSISSGYLMDMVRIDYLNDLNVKWTRTGPSQFYDDDSHIATGRNAYRFGDLDSVQCTLEKHHLSPILNLEAGPVQYNADPERFSPHTISTYKTPADFATWCTVIAKHEAQIFPDVHRYSEPGNEVNSNPQLFPGGDAQIAAYAEACYKALKAVDPKSFVYGFELNMDASRVPVAFVQRLYDLGCKVGTCYDGISAHLGLKYPIPPPDTPCNQNHGTYSLQCLADIRTAAHAPVHILIGETVYTVPKGVPDEQTKALAIVAAMKAFASVPYVDGVNYANVDECDLYPDGFFMGGCIVDSLGHKLPGYVALKALSTQSF